MKRQKTLLTILFVLILTAKSLNILAEEIIPLVENPETLKRLDPQEPIWVSSDRSQVVLIGKVCLREGLLELFACRTKSKEHESIVAIDVKPYLIHAALLVIGAKQGTPAKFDPVFVPPSGESIEIQLFWKDKKGEIQSARAQDLIREVKSKEPMKSDWVFTGGLIGQNSKGQKYYLADISGEIIGVSNFPGSVMDVPFESSTNNEELYYEPNTDFIPEIGTEITLILTKKKNESSTAEKE
ncbi:MAG: YdjY domain-containing protein [Planctomycetia bacterium]|nr:YdjY domain-containing protein [Planctomycetia bacterium]